MKQFFKSIYFSDHPATDATQRHIRIAFGDKEQELYKKVQYLNSEEIRRILGMQSFENLTAHANSNALSINRACISLLHRALQSQKGGCTEEAQLLFSDPLIATYRGGNGEVLHEWFPFLEGFSPRFVRGVLKTYAPNAKRILDPFGGTGTAPLTAAMIGLTGFYCEINPVLQVAAAAKYSVLQLASKNRTELAKQIGDLAFGLGFQLQNQKPDERLRDAYSDTFRDSRFYDGETFEDVLRLRTFCDDLAAKAPLLGQIFITAVLASLVPTSLMVRRGDLRYRTPDELKRRVAIRREVSRRLEEMAGDVQKLEQASGEAILVAEDAQSLAILPKLDIDCVITSPPYLNGTNYFRNTKLELWFLRAITKSNDLAFWRSKSLTAGINDVTKDKCDKPYPSEVKEVLNSIKESAYDSRIPLMIASYFRELEQMLSAVSSHLIPGAIMAIDIGDSRYSGVHVETDRILLQIAARHGCSEVANHTLRVRKSHDGGLLREVLLVLEYRKTASSTYSGTSPTAYVLPHSWAVFKSELPHQLYPFSKRNWGNPLHSLCSYEGKLKPAIAHFLIKTFVPEGGSVLDPFAGVGTIPFEACLQGRKAFGFDISPTAFAISAAKVSRPSKVDVEKILENLETFLELNQVSIQEMENAHRVNFNHCLDEFYQERTLHEIILARRYFLQNRCKSSADNLVLACLLHILHGNRPYALSRRSHPVTPFAPTGPFEYRSLMDRLRAKVERSLNVEYPNEFLEGHFYMQDATSWWPREVDGLDAVITSPPFFDSTRFYLANWIRLWFSGWERADFDIYPVRFLDIRQKQSMKVYEPVFRQARERLKPGGVLVLHLGKSTKCDMANELTKIADPWFKVSDLLEESVSHCETHGIADKGTVTAHQYLVLD